MASGMCACWADVVQEELLQQLCPEEFKRFTNTLLEMEVSQGEFFHDWRSGEDSKAAGKNILAADQIEEPFQSLLVLMEAFKLKSGGLELDICFHDPENGDRYDEVAGLFYIVSGVFQYTPSGDKYKQFIERKGWVEYG